MQQISRLSPPFLGTREGMSQDETGSKKDERGEGTPAAQDTSSSSSILLSLPTELQLWIIDVCDIPSKLALRMTNHHFRALIRRPTHADLLAAEKTPWGEDRDLFSCMDCLRLRRRCNFADAMTKGPKGKQGKEPQKRFCLYCGLNPKPRTTRYSLGSEVKVGGERFVFCKACKRYDRGGGQAGSGLCILCWTRWGDSYLWSDDEDEIDIEDYGYDEYFWECYDPKD